jgi:hypothetical protein
MKSIVVFAGLLALIAVLYFKVLLAPALIWDDGPNIFDNPWITSGDWQVFWQQAMYCLYVPVTSTFWIGLYKIGGGSELPFRVFNVLLHGLNSFLVFKLCLRFLPKVSGKDGKWPALIAAVYFAMHPLQVGTVAWISGERELLATSFALSAIWLFYSQVCGRYFSATLLFALSLLSKPSVVSLPVAMMLVSYVVGNISDRKKQLLWLCAWLGLSAISSFVTMDAQKLVTPPATDWWWRPLLAFDSLAFQFFKTLLPWPLAVDYGHTVEYIQSQSLWHWLLLGVGTCALVWALRSLSFGRNIIFLSVLWLLLFLPTSGLLPAGFHDISLVADHYNYFPLTVVAFALAWALQRWENPVFKKIVLAVIVIFGILSFIRTSVWTGSAAFFQDMYQKNPASHSANAGLGTLAFQEQNFDLAEKYFKTAYDLRPNNVLMVSNYSAALIKKQKFAESLNLASHMQNTEFRRSAAANLPMFGRVLDGFARASVGLGNFEQGLRFFCLENTVTPDGPDLSDNLTKLKSLTGQGCP